MSETTHYPNAPLAHAQEVATEFINFIGNHERKIGLAAICLVQPRTAIAANDLKREFNQLQGRWRGWRAPRIEIVKYCRNGLVPGGVLQESEGGYAPTREDLPLKRSLTHVLIHWSLQHPDMSLQQIFGFTSSKGAHRSPFTRYRIYELLLSSPNNEESIRDVTSQLELEYRARQGIEKHLQALGDIGILQLTTKRTEFNPVLEVTRMHAPSVASEGTNLLLELTGSLPAGTTLPLNEVLKLLAHRTSEIDLARVRVDILRIIGSKGAYAGLTFEGDTGFALGKISHVTVAQAYKEPLSQLYNGIEAAIEGRSVGSVGYLKRFLDDREQFAALAAKARRFSRWYAASSGRGQLEAQILALLNREGSLTVKSACGGLAEEYQRQITHDGARIALNDMVRDGLLRVTKDEKAPYSRQKHNVYHLPSKD